MMQALYLLIRRKKKIIHSEWENDWQYLPIIKELAGLAGLFSRLGQSIGFLSKEAALRNERAGSVPSRMDELQDD